MGFTGGLALLTFFAVNETAKQRIGSVAPLLAPYGQFDFHRECNEHILYLKNVGLGPAINIQIEGTWQDRKLSAAFSVLGAGDDRGVRVGFSTATGDLNRMADEVPHITIKYSDSFNRSHKTVANFEQDELQQEGRWQVLYYSPAFPRIPFLSGDRLFSRGEESETKD